MSDPERLSQNGSTEERLLLEAGRAIRASAASRQRGLVGLGLASATVLASSSTAAAVAKSASGAAGLVVRAAATKWVAGALLLTAGGFAVVEMRHVTPPPAQVTSVGSSRPASSSSRRQSVALPSPNPSTSPAEPSPAPLPEAKAPMNVEPPTKRSEVELIDAARQRLATGKGAAALSILNEQLREYPRGNLALEARALRIEALAAAGQRERALAEARTFLTEHPNGLMSHRVRRWLEQRSQP